MVYTCKEMHVYELCLCYRDCCYLQQWCGAPGMDPALPAGGVSVATTLRIFAGS